MESRKNYKIVLFVIIMIMINYYGKVFAYRFSLPVWFDSLGTVLTAYICDPFCGAVVGMAGNIMYGIQDPLSYLYALTSVSIGVIVGICARKKMFDTVFGTLSVSVIVTLFSVIISTPINIIINDGMIGNMWGDGVISYLRERDLDIILSSAIGEFYVDFLDKVITLMILYFMIRLAKVRRKGFVAVSIIPFLLVSNCFMMGSTRVEAKKADSDLNDNNIQVIYNSDNGLPCGEANDVIQSNDGVLWVGTYAGLYRYSGGEFKWMNEYDSVRNVNCLYLDEEGRLWIGTNDNGFSISIDDTVTNVIDESRGLPSNSVRCITQSSNDQYYIGTSSSLQIMTLNGGLDFVKTLPEIVYAHSIDSDDKGNVATVTNDGNFFLINDETIVKTMTSDVDQELFTSVVFGEDGTLYVGTSSNAIYCYSVSENGLKKTKKISCGQLNNINRMYFVDEIMYICSDNGIGYLDSSKQYHFINTGSFNNSIDNMTVDYQGNMWFSSSRLGLLKMSPSGFTDIYRSAGMTGSVSNSVVKWKDRLYVGTDIGLDIIDVQKNRQIKDDLTDMLTEVRIRCLTVDSKNNLWISTYGKGLLCVSENGDVNTYDSTDNTFGDWARVAIELSDGQIAAACDTGLGFFRDGKLVKILPYEEGLSKSMILCLVELSDGRLLCGTDGDGIAVIEDGELTERFSTDRGLSSNVVLRIVEDPIGDGSYIVTSNGLCYMDGEDKIRFLHRFPYYNNYDVWPTEKGELYVLGSSGIYVTNRDDVLDGEGEVDYELLDSKKGLKAALTANSWDYMDDDGNLYLSSDNGVFRMNVNSYMESRRSYRMMITSINLDNESYEIEKGETFDIGRNVSKIEIVPEVINYTSDDPMVQYYLEGFDEAPTRVPQSELSSVVYTNLPSGKYRFHLSVLDSKNEKIIEESIFDLKKQNELHDTRWFRLYMIFVGMLAVAWFTWFIVRTQIQRTLNYQKRELEFVRNQVKMGNETILAIAKTVDAKDENTSQHSQRVSEYSVLIARELGFSEKECENIKQVALLHDIGKIGIPDRVLNKPAKLTDEEYALMKSHVTRGAEILKDFTLIDHVIEGALYHHEKYDGTGYPQGLSGEDIPLYGRIIGVADAFDAMTANRVYRKKLSFDYVVNELKRCSGTQFDPEIVEIMLKLINENKIDVSSLYKEVGQEDGSADPEKEAKEVKEEKEEDKKEGESDK